MRAISATELRARLGEALNRASAGERVLIERDHRALAVLISPEDAARLDESAAEKAKRRMAALDRLAAFRGEMDAAQPMGPTRRRRRQDAAHAIRADRDTGHGDHG
jgi:prevent-host-death family protein